MEGKKEWKAEVTAKYMNKMTRKQASLIFRARTRMLKVKSNYKNAYANLICRACKQAEETQNHVLVECPALHPDGRTRAMDPFSDDINILKETARTIENVMKEITSDSTGSNTEDRSEPSDNNR